MQADLSIARRTLIPEKKDARRVAIMGAAGRDFHNFNVVYRDDPSVRVVAFTATQIPEIADRHIPFRWRENAIRRASRSWTRRTWNSCVAGRLSTR
jgi:predicted GTPase